MDSGASVHHGNVASSKPRPADPQPGLSACRAADSKISTTQQDGAKRPKHALLLSLTTRRVVAREVWHYLSPATPSMKSTTPQT